MEEKFLSLLRAFGLDEREGRIYLFLLTDGKKSANECARFLGVSRMEAYRLLRVLEKKRLVLSVPGRPVRYEAEDIEVVTSLALEEGLNSMKRMEMAREELITLVSRLPKQEIKKEERFRFLQGREQIYRYIDRMIERASNKIDMMITSNDLVCLHIMGSLERLASKGAKINARVLTNIEEGVAEHVSNIIDYVEVRHSLTSDRGRLAISDGSTVLTSLLLDATPGLRNERDVAMIVEGRDFAQMMGELFDLVFSNSPPGKERLESIVKSKDRMVKLESIISIAKAISIERGWGFVSPAFIGAADGKKYTFSFQLSSGGKSVYADIIICNSESEVRKESFSTIAKKVELAGINVVLVIHPYDDEVERVASIFGIKTVPASDPVNAVSSIKMALE